MAAVDWIVIAGYLSAMLALSVWLSRRQKSVEDYYLGGRRLSAGAVGISTLATQSSAISFISIPAFVALRPEGGLRFLQYELALPLAMAALSFWWVPALRGARVLTIYAFLEQRFDRRVRRAVAGLFLLGRGLATGVALYATGLVLQACLDTPLWANLLVVGAVTVAYDLLGGMTAVVYSDVIQMGVLALALVLCVATVVAGSGGLLSVLAHFPVERVNAFAPPGAGGGDSLWAYVIGGAFLYASYYGCDQSQAQRILSTAAVRDSQRALLLNGLGRFPLVCAYCALGVAASAALATSPELARAMADAPSDALVPQLLRTFLPAGVRGLVFAGLLAAAMSSLDSALNALSASTAIDFAFDDEGGADGALRHARALTFVWGALITLFSFFVGDISKTVIEAINKVGSAVYGPVLAVFTLALWPRRPAPDAVLAGLSTGFACNISMWLWLPSLHFLWWNPIGCGLALSVAVTVDRLVGKGSADDRTKAPTGLGAGVLVSTSLLATSAIATVMWLLDR